MPPATVSSRTSCFLDAAKEYDKLQGRVFFPSSEARVGELSFPVVQCQIDGKEFYHHTNSLAFENICKEGFLRPLDDPLSDGTVNFTSNPNFHRFGSVRLVFDRDKVAKAVSIKPMNYVVGEYVTHEFDHLVDLEQSHEQEQGRYVARNRIESNLGIEPDIYINECKTYTRDKVPLSALDRVEYWVPWQYGNDTTGCHAIPKYSDFTVWSTGVTEPIGRMETEIRMARQCAEALGVPFSVQSCYPFIVTDHDEQGHNTIPLDRDNLEGLTRGIPPVRTFGSSSMMSSAACCCAPEELPGSPRGP